MSTNFETQAAGLAGVLYFASAVHQAAANGEVSQHALQLAIHSIRNTSPSDPLDVYGGYISIQQGLNLLAQHLAQGDFVTNADGDKLAATMSGRYTGQLLRLANKFSKHSSMMSQLRRELDQCPAEMDVEEHVAVLAELYTRTISTITPRIVVQGQPEHLKDEQTVAAIRCLLLAGVRCGFLWQQGGGAMWRLVMQRRKLISAVEQLKKRGQIVR